MTRFAEGAARVRQKIGSAFGAPLMITIAVIAIIGALYYAFYRNQVDYYTGRNLRLISTLAAQIEGRIGTHARELRARGDEVKRGTKETGRGWVITLTAGAKEETVRLDDVLQPIFARRVGAAFDMVLIANDKGQILYSFRTPPPASSLLTTEDDPLDEDLGLHERTVAMIRTATHARAERESRSALVITNLGAIDERRQWREYVQLNPARLLRGTEQFRVRLGDADYLLFAQPYPFARGPQKDDAKPWIICGLVSASRFRYDVSAVSASVILVAIGIALIALCCWPFLRIALIHPGQELTIGDVALIVICTAVGACVLTLAMLDVFAYRQLAAGADEQLRAFGKLVVKDFGDNVRRAMTVLNRAQQLGGSVPTPGTAKAVHAALNTQGNISEYPYIDSIAWIDPKGDQKARFDAKKETRLGPVGQRQYFRDALINRTWTVHDKPYVLEWVRSRSTGEVRAVLAKNTRDPSVPRKPDPPFPVIAMSTDLIDVTYAVRPTGVALAIIDENGEVVYHSDTERIGYENFFTETDRNRALRSAVLSRRESHVSASYWGEDKSMFVTPLEGSRWTLIVYRAKRLTRVLNVEAALLTLVLLLMSAAPYVLLYAFVLIVAPRYRAPSLWPDQSRRSDYVRLCVIYLALLILFALTIYVLTPWSSFWAVMMIPGLAVLSTYLVLHRIARRRGFFIAAALWIAMNAALFAVLISSDVDAGRFFSRYPIPAKTVLVLVAIAVASLTAAAILSAAASHAVRRVIAHFPVGYSILYRLCGVLLLVLCSALPVAAFFNISRHVESELLVKYGQLRAAADLEHRIDRLETLNMKRRNTPEVHRDIYRPALLSEMFSSTWLLKDSPVEERAHERTVPAWATTLMPALYEDSIAIRPLFEARTRDLLWTWSLDPDCSLHTNRPELRDCITLERKVRFDVKVSDKLWPDKPTPPNQKIVISSVRTPARAYERGGARTPILAMLLSAAIILIIFWYACGFIAERVLLMDVTEPHWMARLPLSPTLGDHIFLVRREKDAAALTGDDPMGKGLPFLTISFEELDRTDGWDAALETLDSSPAGRNSRIADFEYEISNGEVNLKKLEWLERLLSLPDRTVIMISTVTPAFVMTVRPPKDPPPDYLARWRAVLDRFVTVTAEELELRHQEWKRRQEFRTLSQLQVGAPKNWLEKETAYNPFLRRLRDELEPGADRAHLLDEISERAETYYAGLWASCRQDEKLLLYQLARNGLANGRNRRTLRRLIARGLVRHDPNLQLFSETFRLFVLGAAAREDIVSRARAEQGASTWDALRIPFFIVIIAFLLLLFATQKDLLTTTTALATALTTGLPILMKIVGVFSEKRAGGEQG